VKVLLLKPFVDTSQQLKSENERLKEETRRFLPDHVGTLSIREVEQIENQLQKLLREIEKIRVSFDYYVCIL